MQLFVVLYRRSGLRCITTTVSLLQPAVQILVLENKSVCNFLWNKCTGAVKYSFEDSLFVVFV